MKLSEKQKRFCDEYLIDLNATQAAIRAGYSQGTASEQSSRLLTNVKIQNYIAERMAQKDSELIASQDEVLQYLTKVMRREEKENVVVTLQTETSDYKADDTGVMRKYTTKKESVKVVEIPTKVSDANKAAELLGKRYQLYTDKVQALGIIVPAIVVYTRFETLGNISLLFAAQIHHTKAVSVTFISVALHALPCDVLAVG